jgi:hypothetical protein
MPKPDKVFSVEISVRLVVRAKDIHAAVDAAAEQCMTLDGIEATKPVGAFEPASGTRWLRHADGTLVPV